MAVNGPTDQELSQMKRPSPYAPETCQLGYWIAAYGKESICGDVMVSVAALDLDGCRQLWPMTMTRDVAQLLSTSLKSFWSFRTHSGAATLCETSTLTHSMSTIPTIEYL